MENQQVSNCGLGFFGCVCSLYKYEGTAWGLLDEKALFNAICSSFGLCILAVVLEAGQAWGMRTWHRDQMSLRQSLFAPHVYISDFCLLVRSNGALLCYL